MSEIKVPKSSLAQITIQVPAGCKRQSLSIDALDSRSRKLAYGTTILVDGKPLLCRSFRVIETESRGSMLVLEIAPECYEITEKEPM